jgi:ribosome-binding factor A
LFNIALMKMSDRSRRLAGTMQQLLPEILRPLLDPDKMGFVTVTAIEVSGDLGVVDVYVRSLGGPASYLKELQRMEKKIAHLLLQKLELRRAFTLRFKPDQAVKAVQRLEDLGL